MASPKFYQINTLPQKKGWFNGRNPKGNRRRQIVVSVIGAYVVVGGLLGYALFHSAGDSAKANETAYVNSSLRWINSDKDLSVGDKIDLSLTLYNTSTTESINDLAVDLFSTKDAVSWTELSGGNANQPIKISPQNNTFQLPVLSSGERVEYAITGTLQNNASEYVTILGKIRFLNKEGNKEENTNRVFTKLKNATVSSTNLVTLAATQDNYGPGDAIPFTIQEDASQQVSDPSGKIYISKADSKDVVTTLTCSFDDTGKCSTSATDLASGEYSALYIDENENFFSNIFPFRISGSNGDFVPAQQATLNFPFGSGSIDGLVPVIAKHVLSLNSAPKSNDLCVFNISTGDKVVTSVKAPVDGDRNCATVLNASQIPQGDGIYSVSLQGLDLKRDISFLKKPIQTIQIQTDNVVVHTGQDISIQAQNIQDKNGVIMASGKATVGIWHNQSGEYHEVSSVNGSFLGVQDGRLQATLPADLFNKGGLYSVNVKLDDGQQSDFLALNFDDKAVGLVDTGVMVENYDTLKVNQTLVLTLNGVRDRNNNPIQDSNCAADLYATGSGVNAVSASGEIKNGTCKVVVPAGKITHSGPLTVSLTGDDIDTKINQSSQFTLASGPAEKFGGLNLEFEPARKGYANNLLVGPVTDKYGNLANSFNQKLRIYSEGELKQEIQDINIVDGFAKVVLPASTFDTDKISLKLVGPKDDQELLSRNLDVQENNDKLILPNFPQELNGDKNIQVGVAGFKSDVDKCKLSLTRSQDEISEIESDFDKTEGKCAFDWSLNQHRDNSQALLNFEIGNNVFHGIVHLTSGEATSLFAITPQVRIDDKNEAQISLLTSPIVDKNGLPVEQGEVKIQYNGKLEAVPINKGVAKLDLIADKLDPKDIRTDVGQRFLDLNLDAKAGVVSISKTNDLSIYLGDKEIANQTPQFKIKRASTQINNQGSQIFEFQTDACEAYILSSREPTRLAKTHMQGDSCYVEVSGEVGDYTLLFNENGFSIGTFDVQINTLDQQVVWCQEKKNCLIQVQASINSKVEATVYDEEKQFKFNGDELDNLVTIKQNGLNPLKKYLVQITFTNNNNQQVSFYREILGDKMLDA